MLENIRLSFQGIWSHKMRSFLTMLGIIIGLASIISIVSTIKGTQEQIKKNLIGSGNNTVEITLEQNDWAYEIQYNGLPQGVSTITEEQVHMIREVEEIESVATYVTRAYADGIYYKNTPLNGASIYGVDDNYLKTCGYQITMGRGFIPADSENFSKENYKIKTKESSIRKFI